VRELAAERLLGMARRVRGSHFQCSDSDCLLITSLFQGKKAHPADGRLLIDIYETAPASVPVCCAVEEVIAQDKRWRYCANRVPGWCAGDSTRAALASNRSERSTGQPSMCVSVVAVSRDVGCRIRVAKGCLDARRGHDLFRLTGYHNCTRSQGRLESLTGKTVSLPPVLL
jgi:hypothetical protein